jgi:hypothetical protein
VQTGNWVKGGCVHCGRGRFLLGAESQQADLAR